MDQSKLQELIIKELDIEENVIKIYLKLLLNGKMSIKELGVDKDTLDKLIEYGAIIEINGIYQALNPKFAITNMYRMQSFMKGKNGKRNANIDRIATILEGLLERMDK